MKISTETKGLNSLRPYLHRKCFKEEKKSKMNASISNLILYPIIQLPISINKQ